MVEQAHTEFSYRIVECDRRTLLGSTCRECGAAKLVSDMDGSLAEWEEKHSEQHATPLTPSAANS